VAPSDFSHEYPPETASTEPYRFMGDVDAALMQQVLDVLQ
jgi:hypothetical protein